MEFTFHNSRVIIDIASSAVIFLILTELSCWPKDYSIKATLLIGWSHRNIFYGRHYNQVDRYEISNHCIRRKTYLKFTYISLTQDSKWVNYNIDVTYKAIFHLQSYFKVFNKLDFTRSRVYIHKCLSAFCQVICSICIPCVCVRVGGVSFFLSHVYWLGIAWMSQG